MYTYRQLNELLKIFEGMTTEPQWQEVGIFSRYFGDDKTRANDVINRITRDIVSLKKNKDVQGVKADDPVTETLEASLQELHQHCREVAAINFGNADIESCLKKFHEYANRELKNNADEIKRLSTENRLLQKENKTLTDAKTDLTSELTSTKKDLDEANAKIIELKANPSKTLQQEIDTGIGRYNLLSEENNKLDKKNEKLHNTVENSAHYVGKMVLLTELLGNLKKAVDSGKDQQLKEFCDQNGGHSITMLLSMANTLAGEKVTLEGNMKGSLKLKGKEEKYSTKADGKSESKKPSEASEEWESQIRMNP